MKLFFDVEIFSLCVKKLYFKRSFNNISGNRGPLFSQIHFDQTYFGGFFGTGVCPGGFVWEFMSRGFCRGGGGLCYGAVNFRRKIIWPDMKGVLVHTVRFVAYSSFQIH